MHVVCGVHHSEGQKERRLGSRFFHVHSSTISIRSICPCIPKVSHVAIGTTVGTLVTSLTDVCPH